MELWIRSQDKEDLIKVDNIGLAYKGKYAFVDNDVIDDKFYICQFTNDFYIKLGSYPTKERALEVLDEIQKLIMPTIEYNPVVKKEESWEDEYQRTVLKGYNVKVEQVITYVYEMPKE